MSSVNILLAVTGLSPQVVTETVWALAHEDPPWIPDAVQLLTTCAGRLAAEAGLPRALGHRLIMSQPDAD